MERNLEKGRVIGVEIGSGRVTSVHQWPSDARRVGPVISTQSVAGGAEPLTYSNGTLIDLTFIISSF